jgi:hypothetical protein
MIRMNLSVNNPQNLLRFQLLKTHKRSKLEGHQEGTTGKEVNRDKIIMLEITKELLLTEIGSSPQDSSLPDSNLDLPTQEEQLNAQLY